MRASGVTGRNPTSEQYPCRFGTNPATGTAQGLNPALVGRTAPTSNFTTASG